MAWVLIDWGNNQFRMSPFLTLQAAALKIQTEEQGGIVKSMNADEFNALAKANGGLKAVVTTFRPDDADERAEMEKSGSEWLMEMVGEASDDGEHAADKQWYRRVAQAYRVNIHQATEGDGDHDGVIGLAGTGVQMEGDDEWEDSSDESLPDLPVI
ncbi:hypothetical protein CLAIMM_09036 [Cladophialophora immunda]|nr:hypothetical protein CLAIMM_09036 [Cladophialophora immunda]